MPRLGTGLTTRMSDTTVDSTLDKCVCRRSWHVRIGAVKRWPQSVAGSNRMCNLVEVGHSIAVRSLSRWL